MPAVYPITTHTALDAQHFPHMAKRDAATWIRFLRAHGAEFLAFSYDVALGGIKLTLPSDDPDYALGWQYSTALKIDAVAWKGNQAWIIEVRPEATISAFGAAVGYSLVAQREQLTDLPLVPCIVCETIQLDVEWLCRQVGVQVVRV